MLIDAFKYRYVKVIPLFKNEKQLIARAEKNHRDAQQHLYEKYSGKMLSVCRMYIKDLQHAEDTMLTGFFKVFTHLKDFKHEGSFEGWVRRIMIRESISFLRKKNELEFKDEMESVRSEGFDAFQDEIDAEHIQQLIDELPEGYKAVFVLYAVEGYKHAEIADLLKITVGTSKSQLFKAKKMLQEQLEQTNTSSYGN